MPDIAAIEAQIDQAGRLWSEERYDDALTGVEAGVRELTNAAQADASLGLDLASAEFYLARLLLAVGRKEAGRDVLVRLFGRLTSPNHETDGVSPRMAAVIGLMLTQTLLDLGRPDQGFAVAEAVMSLARQPDLPGDSAGSPDGQAAPPGTSPDSLYRDSMVMYCLAAAAAGRPAQASDGIEHALAWALAGVVNDLGRVWDLATFLNWDAVLAPETGRDQSVRRAWWNKAEASVADDEQALGALAAVRVAILPQEEGEQT